MNGNVDILSQYVRYSNAAGLVLRFVSYRVYRGYTFHFCEFCLATLRLHGVKGASQ